MIKIILKSEEGYIDGVRFFGLFKPRNYKKRLDIIESLLSKLLQEKYDKEGEVKFNETI